MGRPSSSSQSSRDEHTLRGDDDAASRDSVLTAIENTGARRGFAQEGLQMGTIFDQIAQYDQTALRHKVGDERFVVSEADVGPGFRRKP